MRVIQITDSHLVAEEHGRLYGLDPQASFDACLRRIRELPHKPDLILHTGDLTDDGSASGYERAHTRLKALGIPYQWIPGNHDELDRMSRILSPCKKAFVADDWQFVLVDSKIDLPDTHDGA
ncbi:MAG TPA: metallophosphoesterase, partial [Pirellulaceae bacterium]